MIDRHLSSCIKEAATQYPIVAVTGPRQSGKTTLCRELFPDYAYVNLEKPDVRAFAMEDPNGFLAQFKKTVIFDEAQRVPNLFSYLMVLADERRNMGEFILTGSQNFHLQSSISQTLAGRCAVMKLLPFSHRELAGLPNHDIFSIGNWDVPELPSENVFEQIFRGGIPPFMIEKSNRRTGLLNIRRAISNGMSEPSSMSAIWRLLKNFSDWQPVAPGRFSTWIRWPQIPEFRP